MTSSNTGIEMETYRWRYRAVGHNAPGSNEVFIEFEKAEGHPFGVKLSVEDAERLIRDLDEQVRIASHRVE
jgi:hypothetical protein